MIDSKINISSLNITNIYLGDTQIEKAYLGDIEILSKSDYSNQYLTFVAEEDGTINWVSSNSAETKTISYSKDNGNTWIDIDSSESGVSVPVLNGDRVLFKGYNLSYTTISGGIKYSSLRCNNSCILEGNIMSLIYGDDFKDKTSFPEGYSYNFYQLFYNCTGLTSAENLVLPATTLASNCYNGMFQGCTSLVTAPELPATTLVSSCYRNMFSGCTSLVTAPELPATTLAINCYGGMFRDCTSLVRAPELPATSLISGCYQSMFYGCTSLNYIKCLKTNTVNGTSTWVTNVSSTGTFVKAAGVSWVNGNSGIPNGWTVQEV